MGEEPQEPRTPYNTPPPPFPPVPGGLPPAQASPPLPPPPATPPAAPASNPSASDAASPPAGPMQSPTKQPREVTSPAKAAVPPPYPRVAGTPEAKTSSGGRGVLVPILAGVAALALVVGLVGVGLAVSARSQVAQLEATVADLERSQDSLLAEQDSLSESLGSLTGQVGDLTGESLRTYLTGLEQEVETAQRTADNAASDASEAYFRTDYIIGCVNEYMKIVADSGGGYYRFRFC